MPTDRLASGGYRFRYERRIPLHTIAGTGTSLGERTRPDGTRTSALRFTTGDRLTPLGEGRGYWRYLPTESGTTFITGFDYAPGWGRFLDALVSRPLIGWMTAWSFDRLRIWAETGTPPGRPRASRCLRSPRYARGADREPATLAGLEAP